VVVYGRHGRSGCLRPPLTPDERRSGCRSQYHGRLRRVVAGCSFLAGNRAGAGQRGAEIRSRWTIAAAAAIMPGADVYVPGSFSLIGTSTSRGWLLLGGLSYGAPSWRRSSQR